MAIVDQEHEANVARLWQEHLSAAFPADVRGAEPGDIDIVLLDAAIAGCVSTPAKQRWLARRATANKARPGACSLISISRARDRWYG
ncbi:hypothetical protein [Streptomyces nigrescens]|uniref:hypothetical protein n=1 Tax=Streptomyces nigrescens TaxID=1920 RepID=UPI0034991811